MLLLIRLHEAHIGQVYVRLQAVISKVSTSVTMQQQLSENQMLYTDIHNLTS